MDARQEDSSSGGDDDDDGAEASGERGKNLPLDRPLAKVKRDITTQTLISVDLQRSAHFADDSTGGEGSDEGKAAAWELAWADLDEERDHPSSNHSNLHGDLYSTKEGNKISDGENSEKSTGGGLVRRFRACWSKTNNQVVGKGWLIAIFVLGSVMLAVGLVLDTKDAVQEWEHIEEGNWNETAGGAQQQDALSETTHLSGPALGSKISKNSASLLVPLSCPTPPSNLANICSSSSPERTEECRIKCSEAECCFAPSWYPRSCRKEGACSTFAMNCRKLEKLLRGRRVRIMKKQKLEAAESEQGDRT